MPRYHLTWTSSAGDKLAHTFTDRAAAQAGLDLVAAFPGTRAARLTWRTKRGTRRQMMPDQAERQPQQPPATLIPIDTTDGRIFVATDSPVPMIGFES